MVNMEIQNIDRRKFWVRYVHVSQNHNRQPTRTLTSTNRTNGAYIISYATYNNYYQMMALNRYYKTDFAGIFFSVRRRDDDDDD